MKKEELATEDTEKKRDKLSGFLLAGLLLNRRLLRRFAPRNDKRLDFSVIARPALQAVAISRTNRVVRQQALAQE